MKINISLNQFNNLKELINSEYTMLLKELIFEDNLVSNILTTKEITVPGQFILDTLHAFINFENVESIEINNMDYNLNEATINTEFIGIYIKFKSGVIRAKYFSFYKINPNRKEVK